MPNLHPDRNVASSARPDIGPRQSDDAPATSSSTIVEVRFRSGILLVKPTGPVIGQRESRIIAGQVDEGFKRAGTGLRGLVFDLSDIHMMCSMGLGVCLDARGRAASMKARCLVYGISEQLGELFRTLKLTRLFIVVQSPEELRKALAK